MARTQTTIDSTAATQIATARKPRDADFYYATIALQGTFGGGTVTLQMSPDEGTTKINLKDQTGSDYSTTTNDTINIQLGAAGGNSDQIRLYATNTGGTGISMIATVFDNL